MTKFPVVNGQKQCSQCGATKPIDQFSVSRQGVRGPVYRSNCKTCASVKAAQWTKDNAVQHATTKHAWNLGKTYGITPEQWRQMFDAQNGRCAICEESEETRHGVNGTQFRLSVDHCHATGRVRGLLCNRCNRAIGLLQDRIDLLNRAVRYLTEEGE